MWKDGSFFAKSGKASSFKASLRLCLESPLNLCNQSGGWGGGGGVRGGGGGGKEEEKDRER